MSSILDHFRLKSFALVACYVAILVISFWAAYEARFDFAVPAEFEKERLRLLWPAVAVKFLGLVALRQTGTMLRYFSIPDLFRVASAMAMASGILIVPRFLGQVNYVFPRGVLLIDLLLSITALTAFRVSLRIYQERATGVVSRALEQIYIVGAGDTGAALAKELLAKPRRGFKPVAFLDDDRNKKGRMIHGLKVMGRSEEVSPAKYGNISHVILAIPRASQRRHRDLSLYYVKKGFKVETVPAIEDLASGRVKVSQVRAVDVEDLLGRKPVEQDHAAVRKFVEGKVVMVTGAGGSIGSELCRQIAGLNPKRLLMVDQSEPALFRIEQEMNELAMGALATPLIANILDQKRVTDIFQKMTPEIVFHAAAHKHVHLMERQPGEAIRNNSVGTRRLAETAITHKVEAFVLISTDKAINPTNVMGASKRLSEVHLQSLQLNLNQRGDAITKLMAVRFGNVLGSSGSVVSIFRKQIAAGGPVTVTHPDVMRYFMTIPEAVGLVMQASVLGKSGDIFVLDMGAPVKIVELARQMIRLSGFEVDEDIEIVYSGLKPGEKLFEELQHGDEHHMPTEHPRIMRFVADSASSIISTKAQEQLEPLLNSAGPNQIKERLREILPEYTPHLD